MRGPHPTGGALTVGLSVSCSLGFMLFGYDQGVFGGLLSNPSFLRQFNHPSVALQGQIVSTYTIGCILGSIIIIPTGDIMGRTKSVMLGCTIVAIGGLLQATSFTLPHMIVGRIISGIGIGVNTTTIPMWQSETCRPSLRGKLVAIQLTTLVFGFVLTNWMNFGFTYINQNEVSWRFPLAFQSLLAIGTAGLVPFLVESLRWLCLKDRHSEAKAVIARLSAKPIDDHEVREMLEIMIDTLARERAESQIGLKEIFRNGPQQTFRRICLGMGANYFQQMGGVNVVAYYLPVVLERSFVLQHSETNTDDTLRWGRIFNSTGTNPVRVRLNAMDVLGGMTIFVIERFGRRKLMLFGASGCSLCFAVAAIGLGVGTNTSNAVAVAFIFIFYFFFGMSFMSIGFLYPSEINSNTSRNVGAAIAMITNWCGNYIVVSITPVGIQNLGWRFYIIFAVLNFSFIPIIWYFYLETAGLSLDEIDRVFAIKYASDTKMTYKEATRMAKDEVEAERIQIRDEASPDEDKEIVHHVEKAV